MHPNNQQLRTVCAGSAHA